MIQFIYFYYRDNVIFFLCFYQINHDTNIELTNDYLRIKTIQIAQNLRLLGFKKGDIITVIAKNSHHLAPIIFGALCIGCPVNTLDSSFNKNELLHMFNTVKPKLVFCDTNIYDLALHILNELENNCSIYTIGRRCGTSQCVQDLFMNKLNPNSFQ